MYETHPAKSVCLQVRQWVEIQARSRKLSYSDFLSLAERKKEALVGILQGLEEGGAQLTVESIAETVEVLQEGSTWFPGGNKEMRVCPLIPTYKSSLILCLNSYLKMRFNRARIP